MIPKNLKQVNTEIKLPNLENTHISLLKHNDNNSAVNFLENFILKKLSS